MDEKSKFNLGIQMNIEGKMSDQGADAAGKVLAVATGTALVLLALLLGIAAVLATR